MKRILTTAGLLCAALTSIGAAELKEHHLSTRPIDNNITTSATDRKFMSETAGDIIQQKRAADITAQFAASKEFVQTADLSRETLDEIYADLKQLAKVKGVALPLAESLKPSRDLQKVLDSREAAVEREYEQYAERNSLRMLERFYDASRKAEDREVRAFALRYLRPIYGNYQAAKWLDTPSGPMVAQSRSGIESARLAQILEMKSTNAPMTAAVPTPPPPAR